MQTTLLGLAIALILALVTALVGPLFADWDRYRTTFEAEASRLIGMPVRVRGAIDARILPTPSVTLRRVDIGKPGEDKPFKARSLRIEFALGALVRGELSASKLDLNGPELIIGLDRGGQIDWPVPVQRVKPNALSIQRLNIEDGRAVLKDQASGGTVVLSRLWFNGEVRSLAGPFKGEGAFVLGGKLFPYRLTAGRLETEGMKLRFIVDPVEDRQISADLDGMLSFVRGAPHFDGGLSLARPAGVEGRGPKQVNEPWRAAARITADPARAIVQQLAFQYGPDDRALRMRGDARVIFGRNPRIEGALSARQIDLDRWLRLNEADRRRPLAAARALADGLRGVRGLPIAMRLSVSVDAMTLAGATLQRVAVDVRSDAKSWDIETLEFRAPGLTQVALSGRVNVSAKGPTFVGPIRIDTGDTRTLLTWLTDRHGDPMTFAAGGLKIGGDVTLGADRIAIERFKGEFNDVAVDGRLAYAWAAGDRPARLDAALRAPVLDFDRLAIVARSMLADTAFDRPGEGSLALEVGKATIAGVAAKDAVAKIQFDGKRMAVDRLAVADFGGTAFALTGRIDLAGATPRGIMTLDLDARSLDGVNALAGRFAPEAAETLRAMTPRLQPAKLRTTLTLTGAGGASDATLGIEGSAGAVTANIVAGLGVPSDPATGGIAIADFTKAPLRLDARLDSKDGAALLALLGLDHYLAAGSRPARVTFAANGALDGDMRVDARIASPALNADASGTVSLLAKDGPHAALKLNLKTSGLQLPGSESTRASAQPVAADLHAAVVATGKSVRFDEIAGTLAGAPVRGRLDVSESKPVAIDGDLTIGDADIPALLAAAIGIPDQPAPKRKGRAAAPEAWSTEPFATTAAPDLRGRLALTFERATLMPGLAARDLRGVLRVTPSEVAFEEVAGTIAGGRMSGQVVFGRGADGLSARGSLSLTGANAAELVKEAGAPMLTGRLDLHATVAGSGRSPLALIGSINGSGTFSLADGTVAGLDPGAFASVMRSVDQGLAVDTGRVNPAVARALRSEPIAIKQADGAVTINAGRLRLGRIIVPGEPADLAVAGTADLNRLDLDAEFVLTGPADADVPSGGRPAITVGLSGPLQAPKRTIDASGFASWLGTRVINQQARRIEELERKRKELEAEEAAREKTKALEKPPGPRGEVTPSAAPAAEAIPASATVGVDVPPTTAVTPAAPQPANPPQPVDATAAPPSATETGNKPDTAAAPAGQVAPAPRPATVRAPEPAASPPSGQDEKKPAAETRVTAPERETTASKPPAEDKTRRRAPARSDARRAPALPPPINIVPRSSGRATTRQSSRERNGFPPPPARSSSPFDFLLRP